VIAQTELEAGIRTRGLNDLLEIRVFLSKRQTIAVKVIAQKIKLGEVLIEKVFPVRFSVYVTNSKTNRNLLP
jgi:hypothetical protein